VKNEQLMPDTPLLERLKKRKFVQWALAYLAAGFVVVQAMDALDEILGLTLGGQRAILILLVVGFPVTLVVAWYHGERGRQSVSRRELAMLACVAIVAGVALVTACGLGDDSGPLPPPDVASAPGVAVLPCKNMSADPEADLLAASLHGEILLQLHKISSLIAIGRTSVLQYGEDPPATPEIAAVLQVGFVGECAVQRQGDQIRLVFQLLDGETGGQVWGREYERQLTAENLFDIQGNIARWVAQSVSAVVTPEEEARLDAKPTDNLAAYRAYLLGRLEWSGRTAERVRAAIDYFTAAIEEDPNFAQAHAALAEAYASVPFYTDFISPREAWERGASAAQRALSLDDGLSETHVALGRIKNSYEWDWAGAEAEYLTAIALNPNNALAHHAYGWHLHVIGRPEEAIKELRTALRLDPFSFAIERNLGEALVSAGRFGEARDLFIRLAAAHPTWPWLEAETARVLRASGDPEGAWEMHPSGIQGIFTFVALGRHDEAAAIAAQFEGEKLRDRLQAAAALGDADAAMPLLEQAFEQRQPWLKNLVYRYSFAESIRSDPRVQDLIERMGFPE
jgi:TolB-like protein/Flp pilus assembly protein TadD